MLHPWGGAAFFALVTMGVLTLALQAAIMACVVAPERGVPRDREPGTLPASVTNHRSSWRFLVVVHGSRSDVALARDILAAR
jgi:hypothetical protein